MTALRTALLLALALTLSGCFQTQLTVRLNADGSGTLEERVLMNSTMAMAVMMGGMNAMMNGGDEPTEMPDGPYSMEALEARAEALGATLQGVTPEAILFGGGYTATYAFDDIGDLRLDADPMASLPDDIGSEMGMGDDGAPGQPFVFTYDGAQLTVRIPQPGAEDEDDEMISVDGRDPKKGTMDDEMDGEGGPSASDFQQAAIVLRDMRFGLTIELPKPVAQSDAAYLDGRTLTIYDMDFGALLSDPNAVEMLDNLDLNDGPPNMAGGGMNAFDAVTGMRIETAETVTVTFQ